MSTQHLPNQQMDVESQDEHQQSQYHMRSVKFHCTHCKRDFGILNPENNCGTCPRCERVSTTLATQKNGNNSQQNSNTRSNNNAQPQPQQQQQDSAQGSVTNFLRQNILNPLQTMFFDTFAPQPQPQQHAEQQQGQQSNNLLEGLGNMLGFGLGQNSPITNIFNEILNASARPQQPQRNMFGGNPADLFGEEAQAQAEAFANAHAQNHNSAQFAFQAPQQHIVFGLNPFDLLFAPNTRHVIFFNSNNGQGSSDYERLIEEFLRNDPNNYGAAPASQNDLQKLNEFHYSAGACKNVDCTVCQEDYQQGDKLVSLPCGHNYHKDCVVEWLTRHDSCPVCRKSLSGVQHQPTAHQAPQFTQQQQQQQQSGF